MQKRKLEELIDALSEIGPQERLDRQAMLMTYSAANDRVIKKLEEEIELLKARQQEKIADVLKIKQFNEGLEKLRAEAKTEFMTEQEKHEQKDTDEATTSRMARKMMTQSNEVVL